MEKTDYMGISIMNVFNLLAMFRSSSFCLLYIYIYFYFFNEE